MSANEILNMKLAELDEWAEDASIGEIDALSKQMFAKAKEMESGILSGEITDDAEYRKIKTRASTLNMLANRKRYS